MQGNGPHVMVWLIPAAALTLGVVLVWLGFQGRRIDDHPLCRKCGRDLFGLSPVLQSCPDCGHLLQPGDVVHGHRHRTVGAIVVGALLAVPGLLALCGVAAAWALDVSTAEFKPVWMLARELDGESRAAASAELTRRLAQQRLGKEHVQELCGRFLEDQADATSTWSYEKGDFIELAYQRRLLTEEIWDRYVQQGVGPALKPRPVISAGRNLPVDFTLRDLRMGGARAAYSGGNAPGGVQVTLLLYGGSGDAKPFVVGRTTLSVNTLAGQSLEAPYVKVTSAHSALGSNDEAKLTLAMAPSGDPALPSLDSRLWRAPVTLVRRPEQSVKVRDDSQTLATIHRLIEVRSFEVDMPDWWRSAITSQATGRYAPPSSFEARLTIAMAGGGRLPWSCYAVWIDDGKAEHHVGTFIRDRGYRLEIPFTLEEFDGIHTQAVDVILRPDLEAAEAYTDVLEICGGEIVVKDVPVKYEEWYEPHRRKLAESPPADQEQTVSEDSMEDLPLPLRGSPGGPS